MKFPHNDSFCQRPNRKCGNVSGRIPRKTQIDSNFSHWKNRVGFFFIISAIMGVFQIAMTQEMRYLPVTPHGNVGELILPDEPEILVGSPEILVSELKGLIFIDNANMIQYPAPEFYGVQIQSPSLRLINTASFKGKMQSYVGAPISIAMLNALSRDVVKYYRKTDYPVVNVSVPEQDVTNGFVYVVVTEARLGQAQVEGGNYFRPDVLSRYVHLPQGQRLSETQLQDELRWLNESPFRRVNIEMNPGDRYSETDITFKVKDRLPWQFYTGYDDTGTRLTSLERVKFGAIWGNAFGKDHTASYQLTASPNFEDLVSHSGVYVIPLRNHDKFIMYGSYASTHPYQNFGSYGIQHDGHYGEAGFMYDKKLRTHHFSKDSWYEQRANAGFQYKNMNSLLDFGQNNLFQLPTLEVGQITLGYNGYYYSKTGLWTLTGNLNISPGGFSSYNNNRTFERYRHDATADYCYGNVKIENFRKLGERFRTYFKVEGQAANRNLVGSEMFGMGGYGSVRGYDTYFLSADNALLTTLELQTAPISLGLNRRFGIKDADQFSTHVFYDHAIGWNNHALNPYYFDNEYLNSVGVGFRYNLQPYFNIRCDYGWQLNRNDYLKQYHDLHGSGRAHLSVTFSR